MSVKGILFNTEMVRAILDGKKSCTRRLVKTRRKDACGFYVTRRKADGLFAGIYEYDENESMFDNQLEPPYQPGDIIYVRETWHKYIKRVGEGQNCHLAEFYGYKASVANSEDAGEPWHPSIHMPKEAARIWLKVTDVRVEHLNDMTNDDALKEGAEGTRCDHAGAGAYGCTDCMNTGWLEPPILEFMQIWNSTIKKSDLDRYGWNASPWVWVIEFERCEKTQEEHK